MTSTGSRHGVFVSYRRCDVRWAALAIRQYILRELPHVDVFLDVAQIRPGEDFSVVLNEYLQQSAVLLALIGPAWLIAQDEAGRRRLDLEEDWVRKELSLALSHQVKVIPILVDDARLPKAEHLPGSIATLTRYQSHSLRFEEYESSLSGLAGVLKRLLGEPSTEQSDVASASTGQPAAPIHSLVDIFEPSATDNRTLSVIADLQLNSGRFELGRAIHALSAQRVLSEQGAEDLDFLRSQYHVGVALLLEGNFGRAVRIFRSILPLIERVRDESYPLHLRAELGLTRALLELHEVEEATAALPKADGVLFRDQSHTAMMLWLSDHAEDSLQSAELLSRLASESRQHQPEPHFARCIAAFERSRPNGPEHATMLWKA